MTDALFPLDRKPALLGPGAVHVPDWMTREQQEYLLRACARWIRSHPPRTVVLPGGGRMTVRTLSLGRGWTPYRYDDDAPSPPFPDWLLRATRSALSTASVLDPRVLGEGDACTTSGEYTPDSALVNFYGPGATMGLHQDRDERKTAPVVSLSLGDSCVFRFGTPAVRGRPYADVRLESGDLVVFGGPSRLAFHGVPKVFPGTAPRWCATAFGDVPGRINLTARVTR